MGPSLHISGFPPAGQAAVHAGLVPCHRPGETYIHASGKPSLTHCLLLPHACICCQLVTFVLSLVRFANEQNGVVDS